MNPTDQNLHEILLKNFKEAVVFADAQSRIQIFNPVAEKYFEISGKQVLGKKLERVIPYKNIQKHCSDIHPQCDQLLLFPPDRSITEYYLCCLGDGIP